MRTEHKVALIDQLAASPRYRRVFRDLGKTARGEVDGSMEYRPGFNGQVSVYVVDAEAVLKTLPNWKDD